ncbi:MAG: VOC family protein [Paracoccaceae bacterium]|nr:VOC family protein [Paracoccaceae bacterium]
MTHTPDNAAVWFELPVRDISKAIAFYNTVFDSGLTLDSSGPNPMAFFPTSGGMEGSGVSGHLYPGTPAKDGSGPTVHLVVPGRLEDAISRCTKTGGEVLGPVIEIPAGRFAYAKDPDGNSIGLFEAKAA